MKDMAQKDWKKEKLKFTRNTYIHMYVLCKYCSQLSYRKRTNLQNTLHGIELFWYKSFAYNKNRRGPKIEHWGTLRLMVVGHPQWSEK